MPHHFNTHLKDQVKKRVLLSVVTMLHEHFMSYTLVNILEQTFDETSGKQLQQKKMLCK